MRPMGNVREMKQNIQIWSNPTFGEIRTMNDEKGNSWFVGKDVAEALGYKNVNDAIAKHVENEDKGVAFCDTLGGSQKMILINESGLYSLIFSSKLDKAREFKHWVTSEVLPQIRQTGGYIPFNEGENESSLLAKALIVAHKTIELKNSVIKQQHNQLEEQRPKVMFAQTVKVKGRECTVEDLAKMICNAGVEIGQNRLFRWLRNNHYLGHSKAHRNVPYQDFIDQGLFKLRITEYTTPKGRVEYSVRTMVTPKGQQHFIDLFTKRNNIAA